jgi:hypothetical protein
METCVLSLRLQGYRGSKIEGLTQDKIGCSVGCCIPILWRELKEEERYAHFARAGDGRRLPGLQPEG